MQPLQTHWPDDSCRWVALCARRLRERWPRLHLETLEETAQELLRHPELQGLGPIEAAEQWLGLSAHRV